MPNKKRNPYKELTPEKSLDDLERILDDIIGNAPVPDPAQKARDIEQKAISIQRKASPNWEDILKMVIPIAFSIVAILITIVIFITLQGKISGIRNTVLPKLDNRINALENAATPPQKEPQVVDLNLPLLCSALPEGEGAYKAAFIVEPSILFAGDQPAQSKISLEVCGNDGAPAEGVPVRFDLPNRGTISAPEGETRQGLFSTLYTTGPDDAPPNEQRVDIVVHIGDDAHILRRTLVINTGNEQAPEPEIGDSNPHNSLSLNLDFPAGTFVAPGESISLTYTIQNLAAAPVENLILFTIIPPHTSLNTAVTPAWYEQPQQNTIIWRIESLAANSDAERILVVTVDGNISQEEEIVSPEYWLEQEGNNVGNLPHYAAGAAGRLTIAPSQPAAITLTADKTSLKANGQDQTTITAEVKDANGRTLQEAAVSFTAQPQNLGTLTPTGNSATFIAGTAPGEVSIKAVSGEVEEEIKLDLTATEFKLIRATPLLINNAAISLLPADTPIFERNINVKTDPDYEAIRIDIWIPKAALGKDAAGQDVITQVASSDTAAPMQIYVGEGLDDPLNDNANQRLLQKEAINRPVDILDPNSNADLTLVRMMGWVKKDAIGER